MDHPETPGRRGADLSAQNDMFLDSISRLSPSVDGGASTGGASAGAVSAGWHDSGSVGSRSRFGADDRSAGSGRRRERGGGGGGGGGGCGGERRDHLRKSNSKSKAIVDALTAPDGLDADVLRPQLEQARKDLLRFREKANLRCRKMEQEHSAVKMELTKTRARLDTRTYDLKRREEELSEARKERDEAREELSREVAMGGSGGGGLASGISQENGRMIRRLRDMRAERDALAAECKDLRTRLGGCQCGCASGLDLSQPVSPSRKDADGENHPSDSGQRRQEGEDAPLSHGVRRDIGRGARALDRARSAVDIWQSVRSIATNGLLEERASPWPLIRSPPPSVPSGASAPTESATADGPHGSSQSERVLSDRHRGARGSKEKRGLRRGIFDSVRSLAPDLKDEIYRPDSSDRLRGPAGGRTGRKEAAAEGEGDSKADDSGGGTNRRASGERLGMIIRSISAELSEEVAAAEAEAARPAKAAFTASQRRDPRQRNEGLAAVAVGAMRVSGGIFDSMRHLAADLSHEVASAPDEGSVGSGQRSAGRTPLPSSRTGEGTEERAGEAAATMSPEEASEGKPRASPARKAASQRHMSSQRKLDARAGRAASARVLAGTGASA